jgi:PAS domain S-box-containing protein
MTHAVQVLRYVEFAVYVLAAVVATTRWVRRRGANRAWLAATFGLLGLVLVASELLPKVPDTASERVAQRVLVAVLLLFPYFLYRFMATFERPPRVLNDTANGLVGGILVATFVVPSIPGPGDPRPASFIAFLVLVLVEWTYLSAVVSVRLWRAGRGQPTVARRRMRLLGAGAASLAFALVIAGVSPSSAEATVTALVVQVIAIVSALLFLAGFAPPRALLRSWRARDLEAIQGALVGLARATTPRAVLDDLLPRLVRLLGAQGAAMFAADGTVLGRAGVTRDGTGGEPVEILPGIAQLGDTHLAVDVPGGRLEVWTTPYTPYFGRDELDLLRNVAALLHVTLERTFAHEREVAAREALDEAQMVAHLGSWRRTLHSDVIEASDEMYRLYGLEPQSVPMTRQYFASRMHPEDEPAVEQAATEAIEHGGEFTGDYRITNPDGSTRWIHARGRALTDDDGTVVALLGTCQDVTEQRRLDRMRREFVANAAHELRTPLTTVSGMASLLAAQRERLSPAELERAFDALGRQGERARELVTSLLDLSRLESGSVPVQLGPVDVGTVLRHATETAAPPVTATVAVDCPPGLVATADADRLHQIVVNLLANAYKYGGPTVTVTARADAGAVVVTVADDGNGVPADFVAELFQPFSRAVGVTGTPGSGLGLAISRALAGALGGGLTYEPARPRGAAFTLRLRSGR